MRGIRLSLLCALLAFSSMMARSQAASSRNDWVSDLRWGGYVIVFRHGATTSDQTTDAMRNPKADPMSNPSAARLLRESASSMKRAARRPNRSGRRYASSGFPWGWF
jgi:hypothetical protein